MAAAPIPVPIIRRKITELQRRAWVALNRKNKISANFYEKGLAFLLRYQERFTQITEIPNWRSNPDCLRVIIGLALLDYTSPTGLEFWKRWVRKDELVETGKRLTQSLRDAEASPANLPRIINELDGFYRGIKKVNAESQCRANLYVARSLYNVRHFNALLPFFTGVAAGGGFDSETRGISPGSTSSSH